jgi:hypothetical protein
MITFKLVPRSKDIHVVVGAAVVGSVTRKDLNEPVYVPKKLVPLTTLDMIRLLRQMGVTLDVKLEAKIETAATEQQAVLSQARALRFGKKTTPAPVKRSHKKKVK